MESINNKNKKIKEIIKRQLNLINPDSDKISKIEKITRNFVAKLKKKLKNQKIKADVFIGGSFAKKTLLKKLSYDIDIFVRFDRSYDENKLSKLLGRVLGKEAKKIRGSRDYYQLKENNMIIEVIPVIKISRPEQSVNVTDLSYFHVNYLLKKIKKNSKLTGEILLTKAFLDAQNCYGAESYINGFSGYAVELLISHYKTFLNFIKHISNFNFKKEKLIVDDADFYKNKNIFNELNKEKTHSPIILIDPTFKNRNALSSLSNETFFTFQKSCRKFLKKPSQEFFIKKSVSDKFKWPIIISFKTNKQPGDIAGTKSKKFFKFFISRVKREFIMKNFDFHYNEKLNIAEIFLIISRKIYSIIKGPPTSSLKNLERFRKIRKKIFIKNKVAYTKIKHSLNFKDWFNLFLIKDKNILVDMGVREIKFERI